MKQSEAIPLAISAVLVAAGGTDCTEAHRPRHLVSFSSVTATTTAGRHTVRTNRSRNPMGQQGQGDDVWGRRPTRCRGTLRLEHLISLSHVVQHSISLSLITFHLFIPAILSFTADVVTIHIQATTTVAVQRALPHLRTMPVPESEYLSTVWKDGIFSKTPGQLPLASAS